MSEINHLNQITKTDYEVAAETSSGMASLDSSDRGFRCLPQCGVQQSESLRRATDGSHYQHFSNVLLPPELGVGANPHRSRKGTLNIASQAKCGNAAGLSQRYAPVRQRLIWLGLCSPNPRELAGKLDLSSKRTNTGSPVTKEETSQIGHNVAVCPIAGCDGSTVAGVTLSTREPKSTTFLPYSVTAGLPKLVGSDSVREVPVWQRSDNSTQCDRVMPVAASNQSGLSTTYKSMVTKTKTVNCEVGKWEKGEVSQEFSFSQTSMWRG
jgi:hypothetical protein